MSKVNTVTDSELPSQVCTQKSEHVRIVNTVTDRCARRSWVGN